MPREPIYCIHLRVQTPEAQIAVSRVVCSLLTLWFGDPPCSVTAFCSQHLLCSWQNNRCSFSVRHVLAAGCWGVRWWLRRWGLWSLKFPSNGWKWKINMWNGKLTWGQLNEVISDHCFWGGFAILPNTSQNHSLPLNTNGMIFSQPTASPQLICFSLLPPSNPSEKQG